MFSDRDFRNMVLVFAALCMGVGAGLAWGLPWLWGVVKPWLHAVTA